MHHLTVDRSISSVTTITLNRPESLNALTHQMVEEFANELEAIRVDRTCRAVVLTGAGRAFCAGLALKDYGDDHLITSHGLTVRTLDRQRELASLVHQLRDLPQPVVAAVNGAAVGGGLALVCAADIRIAASDAQFAVSFIKAGFSACDLGVSYLLPRIMGAGRAHELMLTGRKFDADEAFAGGLLARVVDPRQLTEAVHETTQHIASNPPLSVELTKQGMWHALEISSFRAAIEFENRQQVITAATEDRAEATAAFLEKRSARYSRR